VWETFAVAGFAFALLTPMHVEAEPHRFDNPREMFMLPEYCKYTQEFRAKVPGGNNPAEIARWTNLMGAVYIHMHHYCYGLMATNRAAFLSPTREERVHNLGVSVIEFDYVIQRAPPDFGLLPEIFTKKGESLIQMDRVGQGMAELRRAIGMKANHWPASSRKRGSGWKKACRLRRTRGRSRGASRRSMRSRARASAKRTRKRPRSIDVTVPRTQEEERDRPSIEVRAPSYS
jgi:hypothetical protein